MTKSHLWIRRLFYLSASVLFLTGFAYVTQYWELQWDTKTGVERRVVVFVGLIRHPGDERTTTISRWLGSSSHERNWVKVAASVPSGLRVQYCFGKVNNMLLQCDGPFGMSATLTEREPLDQASTRRMLAFHTLNCLQDTSDICEVSRRLHRFQANLNEVMFESQFTEPELERLLETSLANPVEPPE
jgi:hypothetical protein